MENPTILITNLIVQDTTKQTTTIKNRRLSSSPEQLAKTVPIQIALKIKTLKIELIALKVEYP